MEVRQLFRAKSPLVDRREVRDSNTLILGLDETAFSFLDPNQSPGALRTGEPKQTRG
jgi:hypothetical protein